MTYIKNKIKVSDKPSLASLLSDFISLFTNDIYTMEANRPIDLDSYATIIVFLNNKLDEILNG